MEPRSQELSQILQQLMTEHDISVDRLTRDQFASVLKQAVDAGDFVRLIFPVPIDGKNQAVVYRPFYEKAQLETEIQRLKNFIRLTDKFVAKGFYEEWKVMQLVALGQRIMPDEN